MESSSSNATVLLDTAGFAAGDDFNQQDLDGLMLLQQHQLVSGETCLLGDASNVVEVGSSSAHPLHLDQQLDISSHGDVVSVLQQIETIPEQQQQFTVDSSNASQYFVCTTQNSSAPQSAICSSIFSEIDSSSEGLMNETVAVAGYSSSGTSASATQQSRVAAPGTFLQVHMDEVESGLGDISSFSSNIQVTGPKTPVVSTGPRPPGLAFQHLLEHHDSEAGAMVDAVLETTATNGVMDMSTSVMDSSTANVMLDASTGTIMMDTSATLMDTSAAGGNLLDTSSALMDTSSASIHLDIPASRSNIAIMSSDEGVGCGALINSSLNSPTAVGANEVTNSAPSLIPGTIFVSPYASTTSTSSVESTGGDVLLKSISLSPLTQIIKTSSGQFILKQSPMHSETIRKILPQISNNVRPTNNTLKTVSIRPPQKQTPGQGVAKVAVLHSGPVAAHSQQTVQHQQIRLLPNTAAPRTVVLGTAARSTPASSSGHASKISLEQAQKLGLLSPKKSDTVNAKVVMRPLSNQSGPRFMLTSMSGGSPQTLLLKSPVKSDEQATTAPLRFVSVSGQQPKIVIKSTNHVSKGVVRSQSLEAGSNIQQPQSVIRISAASPAVQAAAAAASGGTGSSKDNMIRLLSPVNTQLNAVGTAMSNSAGHKLIAPSTAQHLKLKPISIAPSNMSKQNQQSCVIIPVSGALLNNTVNTKGVGSSAGNSVVMLPLQYFNQLQGTLSSSTAGGLTGSGSPSTVIIESAPSAASVARLPSSSVLAPSAAASGPPSSSSAPPVVVTKSSNKPIIDANGIKARKPCNCTKSQCLKLYCDCFANGEFCNNCNCSNCYNNLSHEEDRQKAIKSCLDRNPNAFKPKIGKGGSSTERRHNKGCNCKRSGCLKNYCECYEAKIPCSVICKCVGCKNVDNVTLLERRKLHQLVPDPSTIIINNNNNSLLNNNNNNYSSQFSSGLSSSSSSSYSDIGGPTTLYSSECGVARSGSGGATKQIRSPVKVMLPRSGSGGGSISHGLTSNSNSLASGGLNGSAVTYKISQDIVSATCGCILATALRCQKQQFNHRRTEHEIIQEFSTRLRHIIRGYMQTQANRTKGLPNSS